MWARVTAYDDREDVLGAFAERGAATFLLRADKTGPEPWSLGGGSVAPLSPADLLHHALLTHRERAAAYGLSYQRFGDVAAALWPEGLTLCTRDDWVRHGVVVQLISKLARYCATPDGHSDSAHDMIVYAAILESVTRP